MRCTSMHRPENLNQTVSNRTRPKPRFAIEQNSQGFNCKKKPLILKGCNYKGCNFDWIHFNLVSLCHDKDITSWERHCKLRFPVCSDQNKIGTPETLPRLRLWIWPSFTHSGPLLFSKEKIWSNSYTVYFSLLWNAIIKAEKYSNHKRRKVTSFPVCCLLEADVMKAAYCHLDSR